MVDPMFPYLNSLCTFRYNYLHVFPQVMETTSLSLHHHIICSQDLMDVRNENGGPEHFVWLQLLLLKTIECPEAVTGRISLLQQNSHSSPTPLP